MDIRVTLAGLAGLVAGGLIYWGGVAVAGRIEALLSPAGALIAFVVILGLSLAEMPFMVFGLRQMARSAHTPRPLLAGIFALYVAFASVYAAIFVMLTGQVLWGLVLAALGLARLGSGMLVR